jgi:hypothetical protein
MVGWMVLFGLMVIPGAAATITGHPATLPLKSTSVLFAALLVACLIARLLRTQAR